MVRIGAADFHCALMAPAILARFAAEAPGLRLSFRPLIRRAAIEALLAGDLDVAVGRFWTLPKTLASTTLFRETYSVVVRRGHPRITGIPRSKRISRSGTPSSRSTATSVASSTWSWNGAVSRARWWPPCPISSPPCRWLR